MAAKKKKKTIFKNVRNNISKIESMRPLDGTSATELAEERNMLNDRLIEETALKTFPNTRNRIRDLENKLNFVKFDGGWVSKSDIKPINLNYKNIFKRINLFKKV